MNPKSFEDCYIEYKDFGRQFALRICKNPDKAEDLSQDAFLKILRSGSNFEDVKSFKSYLCRIIVNTYLDDKRKTQRRPQVSYSLDHAVSWDSNFSTEPFQEDPGIINFIETSCLDQLLKSATVRKNHREIFETVLFNDLTGEELALAFNISHGTARSRLGRARTAFQEALGIRGPNSSVL